MLPKVDYPIQEFDVPSTGGKIKLRMMRAREEKILLMAQTTKELSAMLMAIRQVVSNCMIDPDPGLTVFDLEYLFIRLRSVSVSNISRVSYQDTEDGQVYDFEVDLNEVNVLKKDPAFTIISDGDLTIELAYPSADLYLDAKIVGAPMEHLAAYCIRTVRKGDEPPVDAWESSIDERREFVLDLSPAAYSKVIEFLDSMPRLHYEITYTNSMGHSRTIEMTTLGDFFTLL